MKKGFTLIELLAVIVILAVIALIATPIVLGIINDSKNSATIRSAEFYVDAVKNAIMKKNLELNGTLNPNTCEVIDKYKVKCDEVELEVEVDGEVPDSGTITFDRGKTTSVELVFGNRKVVTNANGELVLDDTEQEDNIQVCTLISGETNEIGSKYECEVKPGTKYNFYVLSHEEDGTTNLIMDRNICEDGSLATSENTCLVAWINEPDYGCGEVGDWCAKNDKGPITAMSYLNNATSTWSNIPNLNLTYDDEGGNFNNFEITGKARLPYLSEINGYDGTNRYLYNNLQSPHCYDEYRNEISCEEVENIESENIEGIYEEGIDHIDGIDGYWTFNTWGVSYYGYAHDYYVVYDDGYFGVRPVINLKL